MFFLSMWNSLFTFFFLSFVFKHSQKCKVHRQRGLFLSLTNLTNWWCFLLFNLIFLFLMPSHYNYHVFHVTLSDLVSLVKYRQMCSLGHWFSYHRFSLIEKKCVLFLTLSFSFSFLSLHFILFDWAQDKRTVSLRGIFFTSSEQVPEPSAFFGLYIKGQFWTGSVFVKVKELASRSEGFPAWWF